MIWAYFKKFAPIKHILDSGACLSFESFERYTHGEYFIVFPFTNQYVVFQSWDMDLDK